MSLAVGSEQGLVPDRFRAVGDQLEIKAISLAQKIGDCRVIAKTIELGDA